MNVRCRNCRQRFYEVVARCTHLRDKRGRNCDMICPGCGDSLNARLDRSRRDSQSNA